VTLHLVRREHRIAENAVTRHGQTNHPGNDRTWAFFFEKFNTWTRRNINSDATCVQAQTNLQLVVGQVQNRELFRLLYQLHAHVGQFTGVGIAISLWHATDAQVGVADG